MKHSTRLSLGIGATVTAAALMLSGCSSSDSSSEESSSGDDALTPVTLQLQWLAQAQFAGYYAAVAEGYYEDEGLDVTIQESGTDTVPIDALAAGDVDYAISWVPKVLGSIEQGTNVTDVAQIFERSATTQISFKDKDITTAADLDGKKVGSWGYGNEWELFAGMQKAGIDTTSDITLVQQAFDMNGFLAGDIDAAQAMTYNEYAQVLETVNPETGELYQPDDLNVINWNDEGTAMLQDAIWADAVASRRRRGLRRHHGEVHQGLDQGLDLRPGQPRGSRPDRGGCRIRLSAPSHQLWMTNEINKLIWPSTNGIGMIDKAAWDQTVGIALDTKNDTGSTIITQDPPETAYSNEYVEKALAELKDEGVDVDGADFAPLTVELQEGGN